LRQVTLYFLYLCIYLFPETITTRHERTSETSTTQIDPTYGPFFTKISTIQVMRNNPGELHEIKVPMLILILVPVLVTFLFIALILGFLWYIRKNRRNTLDGNAVTNSPQLGAPSPMVPPRPNNTMYLQVVSEFPEYESIDDVASAAARATTSDLGQNTDEPIRYDYVTAPLEREGHMDEERAVDEAQAVDAEPNTDEPIHYDYVTSPVELYQDAHGESHMDEGRAVDEAQAVDAEPNTDEPIRYDYVTSPVELYQDAHGESHMDEGRPVDEAQAVDAEPNTDEPLHYDYVTAPVELYQDAHGDSHMDEGRLADESCNV
jgi:hypothetical protein